MSNIEIKADNIWIEKHAPESFRYLSIRIGLTQKEAEQLKTQILQNQEDAKKLRVKLKMMEISFEQINNSRNDMIKQLAEQESLNESLESQSQQYKKAIDEIEEVKETFEPQPRRDIESILSSLEVEK